MPKCSRAVTTTLPASPTPFVPLYTNVVRYQRVPVTTVVRNLYDSNLVASGRARERNRDCAITRKHAPATICNGLHRYAPDCTVNWPPFLVAQR